MMKILLAIALLCFVSASAATLQDPPSNFELEDDSIKKQVQDYTQQVTEADLTTEFTTVLPHLPDVNRCADSDECPSVEKSAFLLTISNAHIKMISLDTKNSTQMIQNGKFSMSRSMDYNFRTNKMFWFSYADKTIYTAPLLNYVDSEKQSIMHANLSDIHGIAVDWIYNHIYWVDQKKGELVVSDFNGTMKKVLYNCGFQKPQSIIVNPLSGWMYWADSVEGQIERASMDGQWREIILYRNVHNPQGLALDLVQNRLYWSQGHSFTSVWSSYFDGSDRKLIFKPTESELTGGDFRKIALFDKYIYLLDGSDDVVYKVNKSNGQELEMVYNSTFSLWDLKTYHSTLQPKGENLCLKRIHRCSHFCLPAASSLSDGSAFVSWTTCDCPDGLYLCSDKRSCVPQI